MLALKSNETCQPEAGAYFEPQTINKTVVLQFRDSVISKDLLQQVFDYLQKWATCDNVKFCPCYATVKPAC